MTDPNQVVCAGAIASPEASRAEAWGALGPRPQLRTIHLEREFFVCRKLRRKRAQKHLFAHCKEFTQNFEYTCRLLSALGSGAVRWSLLGLGVLICPLTGITKNKYNNLRDGSGCSTSETDMQLRKSCPRLWPSSMCVHPASRSSSLPGLEPAGDLESTAGVLQPRPSHQIRQPLCPHSWTLLMRVSIHQGRTTGLQTRSLPSGGDRGCTGIGHERV